ncbi:hypothetical protein F4859DRAFT_508710 [Xylaria cf. heliscus]|nr:hypothetical protein F4859DRAFT_508710 [Xylaria cf. heliscus]
MSNIGRSFRLHWSSYLYKAANIFDRDMTISLLSGLEVRIPNNQYLMLYAEVDRKGSRIFNTSRQESLFSDVSESSSKLGRYFPMMPYLMVNHDAGTFPMWAANPTHESALVSVSTNASVSYNDTTTKPNTTSSSKASKAATLSAGGITSILIGPVAALDIVGVGVYFF